MQRREDYLLRLKELFPYKCEVVLNNIIDIVLYEEELQTDNERWEAMVNLLSGDEEFAGAVGFGDNTSGNEEFNTLLSMFPNIDQSYLRNLYENNVFNNFDEIVDHLSVGYPIREDKITNLATELKAVLPNADPSYLEEHAKKLAKCPESDVAAFLENAYEKQDYPTMENYLKRIKEESEAEQYQTGFNIENYLKYIPNPVEYFSQLGRKHALIPKTAEKQTDPTNQNNETVTNNQDNSNNIQVDEESTYHKNDIEFALTFLYNHFPYQRQKDIKKLFELYEYNLIRTANRFELCKRTIRIPRKFIPEDSRSHNIPLLQEIAYIKHKKEITTYLKLTDENYRRCKEDAIKNGLLQTCQCCYNAELIPEECYFCKKRTHIFCKECVKQGALTKIGDGIYEFPCLAECNSEFSIPTLQMVLESNVFSKMAQKMQMEEIKRANLDGLETCPFCEFATIPNPDDKIFHCLNGECGKESCRECRHVSHIPKRCDEIEYDEDVKMRTYIENQMTQALLRKCWKCSKSFIKESGCNKMTCSCGATMCYVCGQAVTDYNHFNSRTCPLYTEDLNRFHAEAVLRGANKAKDELGVTRNQRKLKFDPTKGFEQHYNLR